MRRKKRRKKGKVPFAATAMSFAFSSGGGREAPGAIHEWMLKTILGSYRGNEKVVKRNKRDFQRTELSAFTTLLSVDRGRSASEHAAIVLSSDDVIACAVVSLTAGVGVGSRNNAGAWIEGRTSAWIVPEESNVRA